MSEDSSSLDRRTVLKGLGTAGTVGVVGGAGLMSLSGSAVADTHGNITPPDVAESDDGRIKYVAVQSSGKLTWDGFDEPAQYARIIVDVELVQDGESVWTGNIHDTGKFELNEDWGSSGEDVDLAGDNEKGQRGYIESNVDWGVCQRNRENFYNKGYGLPQNPAPTSYFTAHDDNTKEETRVVMTTEYRLYDENKDPLTGTDGYPDHPVSEGDFVVGVENEESSANFESNGGNASVGV